MSQFRFWIFIVFIFFMGLKLNAQAVYQDINKQSIYEYMDELANLQLINLNTLVKPYSRILIAEKLQSVDTTALNSRQKAQWSFFYKEYGKEIVRQDYKEKRRDLFYRADSNFLISVNPIMGGSFSSNLNGQYWHRWWGGEMFAYLGKNWAVYASLRDQSENSLLLREQFLDNRNGAVYKGSGDFSDFRGGITYQNKYVEVGLIKELMSWGNNQFGANILSTRAPSYPRLNLKVQPLRWFSLHYQHAWLNSGVVDTSRTYSAGVRNRRVIVPKYMAANFIRVEPIKRLNISLGNSIIYSDNFNPVFLIPVAFFKSIDHFTYSGGGNYGGQNTQIFFDISSRNIKSLHLYASVFIDEISFSRFWSSSEHSNFVSGKFGFQWSNIANKNLSISAEATATNPMAYRHFVNSTTFASNDFTLGHYLGDNALNIAAEITYRPMARLKITTSANFSTKGDFYNYTEDNKDVWGLDFQKNINWRSNQFNTTVRYELINDLYISAGYQYREDQGLFVPFYTPDFYRGSTHTVSGSLNFGF